MREDFFLMFCLLIVLFSLSFVNVSHIAIEKKFFLLCNAREKRIVAHFKQKLKPSWIEWLRSMLHYTFVFSSGNAAAAASFFLILLFFLLCKCCFNDSEMEKELKRHIHGIFNEHLKMHHALLCAIYLIQERKKM